MDKRKLIGTIIGVLMFGLLIVGATFAWLTFTANVTNSNYIGTTVNYWVDYSGGTSLTDIPILISPNTTDATKVTVTAKIPSGSLADHVKLHLTTTSATNILINDNGDDKDGKHIVYYAICEGVCSSNLTEATIGTVDISKYNASSKTIDLYTYTFTEEEITNQTEKTFNIYFWLDAEEIEVRHLNLTYAGYIHASASQANQAQQ